ncbi:HTTM domain-containing protein [Candidatus Berkelbacteria bacterium]|nr:HTTM domain-containing protein [Candidatus Berkelbacteria bacterium]
MSSFLTWFFFEQRGVKQAGLFRIAYAILLFLSLSLFFTHVREYFTDAGFAPNAVNIAHKQLEQPIGLAAIHSPTIVGLLFLALVACSILLLVGYQTRPVSIAIWILLNLFHWRNPSILYGGDSVLRVMSFWLIFLPAGAAYGKDTLDPNDTVEIWPYRLAQLQIVVLYLFNGWYKLHGDKWLSGESVFTILNNDNFNVLNFWWLHHYPLLVVLMTWSFFFSVLSFPILVWWKTTRWFALLWMAAGHLSTFLFTNVNWFGPIMIATYLLFLDDEEYAYLLRLLHRLPLIGRFVPN